MINQETRAQIKGYLEGFIQGLIDEHKDRTAEEQERQTPLQQQIRSGALKPFHEAILPAGLRRINTFERSFSTRLGSTFEYCAYCIANAAHKKAVRGFKQSGFNIPQAATTRIEEVVAENNRLGMLHRFDELVENVRSINSGPLVDRPAIADLYIEQKDGTEWFFEIKSPKPNKGQCLEVTQRLLTIQSIQAQLSKDCKTYFAMAYNPYGSRNDYNWPHAKRHLDMQNQVLLQEEFWTIVGDDNRTYEELLTVYEEIGKEKGKYMLDQLAFHV